MRAITLLAVALTGAFTAHLSAQTAKDAYQVVGVTEFKCKEQSKFTGLVTEKVAEMLTGTGRFRVVDRTSLDKIREEQELQKSEEFIDSDNLAEQGKMMGADKLVTGEITKIPVYCMRNADGSKRGYKASVAFQMKIVDVATGQSDKGAGFEGKASEECLSPEAAVVMAMTSMQDDIYEYFRLNIPVEVNVVKMRDDKTFVVRAGKAQGVKEGDTFIVQTIEMLDGAPLPTEIGKAKVGKVLNDAFCECTVDKKLAAIVAASLTKGETVKCKLVVKR